MPSIFGSAKNKVSNYIDEFKAKRELDKKEQEYYESEKIKSEKRSYEDEINMMAREHQINKNKEILNSDVPLGHKVKALNELYKDYSKPKGSINMQELSNKMYLNRMRRDLRLQKINELKRIVQEDKERKQIERNERMNFLNQRKEFNKIQKDVKFLLNKSRLGGKNAIK